MWRSRGCGRASWRPTRSGSPCRPAALLHCHCHSPNQRRGSSSLLPTSLRGEVGGCRQPGPPLVSAQWHRCLPAAHCSRSARSVSARVWLIVARQPEHWATIRQSQLALTHCHTLSTHSLRSGGWSVGGGLTRWRTVCCRHSFFVQRAYCAVGQLCLHTDEIYGWCISCVCGVSVMHGQVMHGGMAQYRSHIVVHSDQ
jgi:hypothetical protein